MLCPPSVHAPSLGVHLCGSFDFSTTRQVDMLHILSPILAGQVHQLYFLHQAAQVVNSIIQQYESPNQCLQG